MRPLWSTTGNPVTLPVDTDTFVAPLPSGGDDAPAVAAILARMTRRSHRLWLRDAATSYKFSFDPWAYMGRADGCTTFIDGKVEASEQIAFPEHHTVDFSGRRTGADGGGGSIEAAADFRLPADGSRALVALGRTTGAVVHGVKLLDGHLKGDAVAGGVGLVGLHARGALQEGCEIAGMIVQSFRQPISLTYGRFGDAAHHANFTLSRVEAYGLAPETTTTTAAVAAGLATVPLAALGNARAGDYAAITLAGGAGVHHCSIEAVTPTDSLVPMGAGTIEVFPVIPAAGVDSGGAVAHNAPTVDVWGSCLMNQVTAIPYGATAAVAPGIRWAGKGLVLMLPQAEDCLAAVTLGGYVPGWDTPGQTGGRHDSMGVKIIVPKLNAHALTECDVLRIENRDSAADMPTDTRRHRVRGVRAELLTTLNGGAAMVRDLGGTDAGRAPSTIAVGAPYGDVLAEYLIA